MKVGCYPGPKGTFADAVARKLFKVETECLDLLSEAFLRIEERELDYCVIPSETRMQILTIVDKMFLETKNVFVSRKVYVPVKFSLAGFGRMNSIKKIYSKEEAFEQCFEYLHKKIPEARKIKTGSTAEMLEKISKIKSYEEAVICSKDAAEKYGIPIIDEDIASGRTSFLVLSDHDSDYKKGKKYATYLIYGIEGSDRYGALEKSLKNIFTKNKVNLNSIVSIPLNGEYVFSIWIDGHKKEKDVEAALKEAGKIVNFLRFCGSCEVEDLSAIEKKE